MVNMADINQFWMIFENKLCWNFLNNDKNCVLNKLFLCNFFNLTYRNHSKNFFFFMTAKKSAGAKTSSKKTAAKKPAAKKTAAKKPAAKKTAKKTSKK